VALKGSHAEPVSAGVSGFFWLAVADIRVARARHRSGRNDSDGRYAEADSDE